MNQNGMQGAAGVPQQMGQQVQQQQPQMPGDQPDHPQIMNFLNEANENIWKEESYRNRVRYLTVTEHQEIFRLFLAIFRQIDS